MNKIDKVERLLQMALGAITIVSMGYELVKFEEAVDEDDIFSKEELKDIGKKHEDKDIIDEILSGSDDKVDFFSEEEDKNGFTSIKTFNRKNGSSSSFKGKMKFSFEFEI